MSQGIWAAHRQARDELDRYQQRTGDAIIPTVTRPMLYASETACQVTNSDTAAMILSPAVCGVSQVNVIRPAMPYLGGFAFGAGTYYTGKEVIRDWRDDGYLEATNAANVLSITYVSWKFGPNLLGKSSTTRSNEGRQYAHQVLDGGSGNAFAGHGEYRLGSGTVTIPDESAVTLPREGIRILDRTAQYIERGDWEGLRRAAQIDPRVADDILGMATYLPGAKVPNYTLKAPVGLTIYSSSATIEDATSLMDLMGVYKGLREWAACTTLR